MKYLLREMKPTSAQTCCLPEVCATWCLPDFVLVFVGKFRETFLNYITLISGEHWSRPVNITI
jgi:hypothetical protein